MPSRVWLPNALTFLNIFCGFVAITFMVHAMEVGAEGVGFFRWAALTICLAALCDALDGRVARALRTSSLFGKELDSLSDVVSFGVAPALLVYEHFFRDFGLSYVWMTIAAMFVCCGAARLARYNVIGSSGRFFVGLPIPAAGLTITGLAMWPSRLNVGLMAVVVCLAAVLMISTLRFPNLEHVIFDSPLPVRLMLCIFFLIALLDPQNWFFLLPISYMVYGLIGNLLSAVRTREA